MITNLEKFQFIWLGKHTPEKRKEFESAKSVELLGLNIEIKR